MKKNLFIGFMAMVLCAPCCFASEIPDIMTIRATASVARTMWEKDLRNKSTPPSWEKVAESVKKLKSFPEIGDNGTIRLLLAQYAAFSSSSDIEIYHLFQDAATISNFNEILVIRQHLDAIGAWHYWDIYSIGSIVYPLYTESKIDIWSDINWGFRSPTPNREPDFVPPLSLSFSRLGLYDLAWRVQMEEGRKRYDAQHSYYLRAADNAYRAGKKELAWLFLMNAAVFDDKMFFEPAMETAKLWIDIEAGKAELSKAEIVQGEERKKLFLEIVARYQKINAHPRAWLFIEEHKSEFDDPEGLIKEVQDDWLAVVKRLTNHILAREIIMYGVQLYPDGADPLSVSIPWPFPEGSLEKLKARLGEFAAKAAEEEKDGFRNWRNIVKGEETTKAKYFLRMNDAVVLELSDGEKITVEIKNLNPLDQNYVNRRKEVGKMSPTEREFFKQLRLELTKPQTDK